MKIQMRILSTITLISLILVSCGEKGSDLRGWVQKKDGWSYYDDKGIVAKDTQVEDKYYVDKKGYMLKDSLLEYKGDTYYLSSDGSYVVNEEKEIDGKSYYFDENGKSIINLMTMNPTLGKCYINEEGKIAKAQWILQDNNWYYATDFGTLATGWVSTLNGDGSFEPYYFLPNGVMLVNAWQDNFYVGTDGKILKNTITPDGQQVDANGQKVVARAKSSYTSAPPMNSAFGPGGGPTGGATSMGSNVIVGGLGQASKVYQAQAEKTAEQQRIQADLDAKQRQKWAAMQDTSKDIQDSVNYGLINSGEYNKSH